MAATVAAQGEAAASKLSDALATFNLRFCAAKLGGKLRIIDLPRGETTEPIRLLLKDTFLEFYANRRVEVVDDEGKPSNWSGFYFGAHSGWQWSQFDTTYPAFGTRFGVSHDSSVVGGQIGIQHQFGNVVLGVEGTLSVAFQDDYATTSCPNPAYNCAARFDDVLTIGPRLGWAMGKWMPYITGGYANARFTEKAVLIANGNQSFEGSARHHGWYIGGGVDMAVSHGWTIGLEYRHYEYDNATHNPACNGVGGLCTFVGQVVFPTDANRADVTSDVVTLRASWKLGRPEAAPLK